MAVINLQLKGQLLIKTNEVILASGDKEVDSCEFVFDKDWNGYIKTAVFYQDKGKEQYAVLDKENKCVIPGAAMQKAGLMCIGVFGINGKEVLTSTIERVEVLKGAYDGEGNLEPSYDVFMAIVAKYQALLDLCAAINVDYKKIIEIMAAVNAFDVAAINEELEEIKNLGLEFKKNFRIDDITVTFDEGIFIYEDLRITKDTLCDVYFDPECLDSASSALVFVETFDGYIKFTSTHLCSEDLTCSIYCMGV